MKYTTVPFVGGFYADENRPFSVQDCLNYLPIAAEVPNTRSPQRLITAPGLKPYVYFGANPIRGMYNAEGRLFVLAGTKLYLVSTNGTATLVGTVPGVGRVSFSHNQISNGNQILVNTGSAGYVYDTVAKTFTRITDAGYPGGTAAVFMDGYIIQIEPARRYAFNSDVADATNYNTLNRFTSEVSPDLLVGLAVVNNDLVLFSQTTTEFFEDTGNTSQPFRTKRITMTRGCGGQFTIVNLDNTLYWLGNDGIFYVLNGYQPLRISTFPIEQAISDLDWSQAFAFTYESKGHKVVYWTFPDGHTWGYDVASRLWHRRESYGFNRWRLNALVNWNGEWIGGDFQNGVTWTVDWDYMLEGLTPFISQRTTGVLSDNQNFVLVPRLELVMETGQPKTVGIDPLAGHVAITGNLPDGQQGATASLQYQATGGIAPYTFTVLSGAIPTGLTLSSSGLLSGTYGAGGAYSWVVKATDAVGSTATLADSNNVVSSLIYTWSLVSGLNNTPMNASFIYNDTIGIGHNGGGWVSYSTNRGVSFSTVQAPNTSMAITGIVYYQGNWWLFGFAGANGSVAAKTTGNNFTSFATVTIPFNPSQKPNCCFVRGAYLYVGANNVGGTHTIWRYDGTTWTSINTGITARAVNTGVACFATSGANFLIGTADGLVMKTTDFVTFTTVFTSASSSTAIVGLVNSVGKAFLGTQNNLIYQSTDNGVTWGSSYTPTNGPVIIGNNSMIASCTQTSSDVYTSITGASGSWTLRLTTSTDFRGYGYATSNLAVYPTVGSFAFVGTSV